MCAGDAAAAEPADHAYAAANVSIPPMVLLRLALRRFAGRAGAPRPLCIRCHGHFAADRLHDTVVRFFWAWLRGGVVLGGAIGAVVGGSPTCICDAGRPACGFPCEDDWARCLDPGHRASDPAVCAGAPSLQYYAPATSIGWTRSIARAVEAGAARCRAG